MKPKKILPIILSAVILASTALSSAVISADDGSLPFEDVAEKNWFYENVCYVSDMGIMNGTSDKTFSPNATLSRAMSVTILYRMAGEPIIDGAHEFSDVPDGKWYSDAVVWAHNNGITKGKTETSFAPNDEVTRAEFVTFLCRYAYYAEIELPLQRDGNLSDAALVPGYAKEAEELMYQSGVVNGLPGNRFVYYQTITRAEAAAMINRLMVNSVPIDTDEFTYVVFIGNSINGTGNIPTHFEALANDSKMKVYSFDHSEAALVVKEHYEWFSSNMHPDTRIAELADMFIIQEGAGAFPTVGYNEELLNLIGDRSHLPQGFPNGFCYFEGYVEDLMELLGKNKTYYTFTANESIGVFDEKGTDTLLGIKKIFEEQYDLPLVYASDISQFNKDLGLTEEDTYPDKLHPTRLMGYCAALALYCSIYDLPAAAQNNGDLKPEDIPGETSAEKDAFMVMLKDTVQDIIDIQQID